MEPFHLVNAQTSKMPYKISIDKPKVKPGETVEIGIDGPYKGLIVEVRKGNKASGNFVLNKTENYFQTINCHGIKKSGLTHKNSAVKSNKTFLWRAPTVPGTYVVVVTIAKDGLIFWTKKPTETITVV
ncbi:putative defense protein 3 [Diorhabda carinulata]|uniref:putative defense protein 3 n=1 Tax=Diorhabda carinulata TaxID=1163345 RepID=UPI0025A0C19A|nr:putative defense protein 3 [Diorhabda carinulata]